MMKKIKTITLIVVAILFTSCNLDMLPESSVSSNSYWETEDDAKAALNGLYSRFRSSIGNYDWLYWFEARSGNIGPGLSSGGITAYNSNDVSPEASNTNWAPLYIVISQANSIILNADKINFINQSTRNQLLAQAYFFRAWSYFNLVRLWGDVPIITNFITSTNDSQLYPKRSSKADVFELIKLDINRADELFEVNTLTNRNRVSRPAILMLKTEIYLWLYKVRGGTAQCLDVAENAIDNVLSMPSSVLSLQSNYNTVFDVENNNEIIFAVYYDINERADQYGTLLAQSSTLVPSAYRNNPILVGNSANHVMAFSKLFYDNYRNRTPNDRRAEFISSDMLVGTTNYRWTKKYMGEMNGNQRTFTTDTRIYRFAEAIMFKAEILAERGNIHQAVIELNKVVNRAYGSPSFYSQSMSSDDFKAALLDERMIEFAGECKSWFDLIRFGEVFKRVPSLAGRENDKKGNILLLPVFNATISLNTNITQTDGY